MRFPPPCGIAANPRLRRGRYDPGWAGVVSRSGEVAARAVIAQWPGYGPTPLVPLGRLAAGLGVASIDYKDESGRFGLGSFKALGGAYAVYRVAAGRIAAESGATPAVADLLAGAAAPAGVTVTCATDGNHGRAVAWGAGLFGCDAVIYVHETVSRGRIEAIERLGARVVVAPGNYDDAVRQAAADAGREGRTIVSDTSWPGYFEIPGHVMQGYAVMVEEALSELLRRAPPPTHVFIQGGVGGLAAAVIAHLAETLGDAAPRIVVVEPERAACIFASVAAGRPTAVTGDLDTIMAGLACGEVSLIAWPIIATGAADCMAIPDDAAVEAMRLLASGEAGAAIVAGELGAAGLAGLLSAAGDAGARRALGLDASSRILLFGTEGATDPELYRRLIGREPEMAASA